MHVANSNNGDGNDDDDDGGGGGGECDVLRLRLEHNKELGRTDERLLELNLHHIRHVSELRIGCRVVRCLDLVYKQNGLLQSDISYLPHKTN